MVGMNLDRQIRVRKRDVSPKGLLDVCRDLANELASGKWNLPRITRVSNFRSITIDTGGSTIYRSDGAIIEPLIDTTEMGFEATKNSAEPRSDSAEYRIYSSVRQAISEDELPVAVHKTLFEEDGTPSDFLYDELGLDYIDVDEMCIERELYVEYSISPYGLIMEYSIIITFFVDDCEVISHTYCFDDEDNMIPTSFDRDDEFETHEQRRVDLAPFGEEDIERLLSTIDVEYSFLTDVDEVLGKELPGGNQEVHIRRILGMIALMRS